MKTKAVPTLTAIERSFDEVDERYARVRKTRRRLEHLRPGSKAYLKLLDDLWTELDWLRLKADVAAHLLDEFEESLPDED